MSDVSFSLILEILVASLLVVMIGYAFVLNRRLGSLRRDKAELEKLALNFHVATERAEDSIGRLKKGIDALQERVEKGESLRDDLLFLSERGGSVADRLEAAVRSARDDIGVNPIPGKAPPEPAVPSVTKPVSPPATEASVLKSGLKADPKDRTGADPAGDAAGQAVDDDKKPVSEAEKELLKALRSVG